MNTSEQPKPEKPRKALTLAERIAVIQEHEKTPNTRHLARMFSCGRTQIQNILRHKEDYLAEWEMNGDPFRIRRRQSTQLLVVNTILHEYLTRCLVNSFQLNDDILKMAAKEITKILEIKVFKTSNRWLERFKTRYRISESELTGTLEIPYYQNKSLKLTDIIQDIKATLNITNFPLRKPTDDDIKMLKSYRTKAIKRNMKCKQPQKLLALPVIYAITSGVSLPKEIEDNKASNSKTDEPPIQEQLECIDLFSDSDESQGHESRDGNSPPVSSSDKSVQNDNHVSSATDNNYKTVANYQDAIEHLKPLEEFILLNEDLRAIGLLNQLENYFKEKVQKK